MAKWGYTISKDSQIDYDKGNNILYSQIIAFEPSFKSCISCGGCAATCSSNVFSGGLSLRRINILISRGQVAELEELKKCMLCGKCNLVCPRGVNTRNVIFLIREYLSDCKVY